MFSWLWNWFQYWIFISILLLTKVPWSYTMNMKIVRLVSSRLHFHLCYTKLRCKVSKLHTFVFNRNKRAENKISHFEHFEGTNSQTRKLLPDDFKKQRKSAFALGTYAISIRSNKFKVEVNCIHTKKRFNFFRHLQKFSSLACLMWLFLIA